MFLLLKAAHFLPKTVLIVAALALSFDLSEVAAESPDHNVSCALRLELLPDGEIQGTFKVAAAPHDLPRFVVSSYRIDDSGSNLGPAKYLASNGVLLWGYSPPTKQDMAVIAVALPAREEEASLEISGTGLVPDFRARMFFLFPATPWRKLIPNDFSQSVVYCPIQTAEILFHDEWPYEILNQSANLMPRSSLRHWVWSSANGGASNFQFEVSKAGRLDKYGTLIAPFIGTAIAGMIAMRGILNQLRSPPKYLRWGLQHAIVVTIGGLVGFLHYSDTILDNAVLSSLYGFVLGLGIPWPWPDWLIQIIQGEEASASG